jgi:4-hydroxybenzoate polyprenyltransferase
MFEVVRDRYPAVWPWIQLTRLDRPIGTMLLMWPTLWAVWMAGEGTPSLKTIVVFVLGVIVMRAAGCVINDYADRNLDGHVSRTKARPLATGALRGRDALMLFAGLAAVAFVLVLFLNRFTIYLSFVGLFLATLYPFTKRFTYMPQLFLGAAFSWAIPMAFAAETGELPNHLWLIYIANLLWTVAYDTEYALCDREDDLKVGIKSTAILFGDADRLMIGLLQAMALFALILLGHRLDFGPAWHLGLVAAVGCFVWQHYLIRERDPAQCFRAFLNNQWAGGCIFAGLWFEYLLG